MSRKLFISHFTIEKLETWQSRGVEANIADKVVRDILRSFKEAKSIAFYMEQLVDVFDCKHSVIYYIHNDNVKEYKHLPAAIRRATEKFDLFLAKIVDWPEREAVEENEADKRFVILPKDKALQGPFRKSVCGTSPRCVVTGCEIADCIEAAHLYERQYGDDFSEDAERLAVYADILKTTTDEHPPWMHRYNGVPLRADVHMLFDIKKDPVVRLRTISAIEKDLKRSKKGDRIAVFEMKKSTCDILGVTVGMSGSGETFVPVGGVSAERVKHMLPFLILAREKRKEVSKNLKK